MATQQTIRQTPAPAAEDSTVLIPRTLTVRELADLLGDTPVSIIKTLMTNGVMADVSKTLDYGTAAIVAMDRGFDPEEAGDVVAEEEAPSTIDILGDLQDEEDDPADLRQRPPVVAVLGHVDHGKTSLLDYIRSANVAEGEAGGITQRVGAYQATANDRLITFIDTPGHAAFTEMRARGAQATDIAILVVAANDGVMPQTREAINHIQAAGVPLVVALNKMDLDNINPDRVKAALADVGVQIEEYGGDIPLVPVSATRGDGMSDLLDTLLLVADISEFSANPVRQASGVVLEAELDRRQGPRTTLLVQKGSLHQGDSVLVGQTWGRIKAMTDFRGNRIKVAGPSTPVVVLGLQDVADAGDSFRAVKSDREAKRIYEQARREREAREAQVQHSATLDALFGEISRGDVSALNLIVKTDVVGSVEALRDSLEQLSNEEVTVKVIHAAAGPVSVADVNLALASEGLIIAFSTPVEPGAERLAEQEGVEVRNYSIIYEVIEEVEAAISGLLEPVQMQVVDGHAEVLQVFPIRGLGNVAGCRSLDGSIRHDAEVHVYRGGEQIAESPISSLRRFQDSVQEVDAGQEFGVALARFDTFLAGDQLEFFHIETQSRIVEGGEIRNVSR
ncbi:MAG: translation initiation factor IF-2 [Chloroflexota bacterium]|nr:translation initiation factor IF-2 [Chloroflexota bacterium]MDE2894939.1 translation initiation factor IF-2 [Chloroflexota bacterium]